jgi:hypothetical protein
MNKHPLAEVFGFPISNTSESAQRYRNLKLCPFNNKVPSCTKDKAQNPLGVCTIFNGKELAITCPVRFREDWLIAEDAASFFFKKNATWTSLTEIRLNDKNGESAGNIDLVLVSYNSAGKITDFGALEIQGVYISGNIRRPFEKYIENPKKYPKFDWSNESNYPRADYLSSSRKRLVPQLIYKGNILRAWNKKIAVAIHEGFFDTLPDLPVVPKSKADVAWFIYSLKHDSKNDRYNLVNKKTVYTKFHEALNKIIIAEPGDISKFIDILQSKLDEKLENQNPPDAPTLNDIFIK